MDELLEAHLKQLARHINNNGIKGLSRLYKDAQAELVRRLMAAAGSPSMWSERATPTQLRAMIAEVEAVLEVLGGNVHNLLRDTASTAADLGARHGVDEFKRLAKHFTGTTPVLPLERAAIFRGLVRDVESSLLKRYELVSRTWTASAITNMERALSVGTLAQKPRGELVKDVMAADGDMAMERWKAERIVQTESAYAHGASKHAAMERTQEDLGIELHKRLIETFDDRTGDDSFLVHGQTVPIDQPFSWKHKRAGQWVVTRYMHPPNRPNDRAVVIPWDPEWEETPMEKPLSKTELRSARSTRWRKKVGVKIPPGHRPGLPYR